MNPVCVCVCVLASRWRCSQTRHLQMPLPQHGTLQLLVASAGKPDGGRGHIHPHLLHRVRTGDYPHHMTPPTIKIHKLISYVSICGGFVPSGCSLRLKVHMWFWVIKFLPFKSTLRGGRYAAAAACGPRRW